VSKLLEALEKKDCKWVVLSDEELKQRKQENQRRQANGEQVYKSRRKPVKAMGRNASSLSRETIDDDDNPINDTTAGDGGVNTVPTGGHCDEGLGDDGNTQEAP
jgi:hypothetical protein